MKVLSLFDGISCGRVALERAGINVEVYHAYEIDENAKKISKDNYPDIVHFNDVRDCVGLDYDKENFDLLLGGSPCQDLSIISKRGKGLKGSKSSLFYEYVRIKDEMNPKYFLFENVVPRNKNDIDEISDLLGVEPILINSSLVSAQNRERLYWTNIPNVTLPKDKNIKLSDIIKDKPNEDIKPFMMKKWGNNIRLHQIGTTDRSKSYCVTTGRTHPKNYILNPDRTKCRLFTIEEVEQLQTLPIGYTKAVGKSSAHHGIGNGWTVDVIAHIFKGLR